MQGKTSFLRCPCLCCGWHFRLVFNVGQPQVLEGRARGRGVRMLGSQSGCSCGDDSEGPGGPAWPRRQLSLLQPRNGGPLNNHKGELRRLHPNSSTKGRGGGNRFHISHKHTSDCSREECMSQSRADNDYRTDRAPEKNPGENVHRGAQRWTPHICGFQNGVF